ncbi:alpha/beta fold hydrolase [Nannocystis punicea]|uniref:Alpha/beta fold hydrolase n=1 Tax=Nannocystis punicea TaxID=2995304 RepID=A0ABY7H8I9_9BACT|nr:alpha/beta fold hydrolase [Nannocystis poenicansa]WAS95405.1 alpha/beta fold hydrolase [Nannocystis poenicansa]
MRSRRARLTAETRDNWPILAISRMFGAKCERTSWAEDGTGVATFSLFDLVAKAINSMPQVAVKTFSCVVTALAVLGAACLAGDLDGPVPGGSQVDDCAAEEDPRSSDGGVEFGRDAAIERVRLEVMNVAVASHPSKHFTINAWLWKNHESPPGGVDVVLISGFGHNALFWEPMARRLLFNWSASVRFVVAVDLPGHGRNRDPFSGLPESGWAGRYSSVDLDDYRDAIISALDKLQNNVDVAPGDLLGAGLRVDVVGGHSMGGLVVQLVQEELLNGGESMHRRYGTTAAMLFAAVPPEESPWHYSDCRYGPASGCPAPSPVLSDFRKAFDPGISTRYGPHGNVKDEDFYRLFFRSRDGGMESPIIPTAEELACIWSREPLQAVLDLVALVAAEREEVQMGAFAPSRGTRLVSVAYEYDYFFARNGGYEEHMLHHHLRGDDDTQDVVTALGERAIHDAPWSAPELADEAWMKALE